MDTNSSFSKFAQELDTKMFEMLLSPVYTTEAPKPLTLKDLAISMAKAIWNCDVHITCDKNAKADAYVIDHTKFPAWGLTELIREKRGQEPRGNKTIVFTSVDKALAAIALALKNQEK